MSGCTISNEVFQKQHFYRALLWFCLLGDGPYYNSYQLALRRWASLNVLFSRRSRLSSSGPWMQASCQKLGSFLVRFFNMHFSGQHWNQGASTQGAASAEGLGCGHGAEVGDGVSHCASASVLSISLGTPRLPFIPLLAQLHRAHVVPQLGLQHRRYLSVPLLTLGEMHGDRGEHQVLSAPDGPKCLKRRDWF